LSTEAITQDMHGSAVDESLPMEARAQSLLSLAMIDVASARPELATDRLTYLLSYYQSTKNLVMQGIVLNAMGDMFTRLGEAARAKDWYEAALVPAAECKNPILLSTLARNLGSTQFALGNYGEARSYYAELDRISTHLVDAESKSAALYSQGLCDRRLGKTSQAVQSFEAGATLCRGTDQDQELCRHLEQLRDIYSEQGMTGKALLVDEEHRRLLARSS
jgi:tetratricopeptide (TPR) repeat protein